MIYYKKFLLGGVILLSLSLWGKEKKISFDPKNGSINWVGKKVLGHHSGKVAIEKGHLVFKDGDLSGGEFLINMHSISCDDIKDPKKNSYLISHLKSKDFFEVEKYPRAKLKITDSLIGKGGVYNVTADLTIKGKTKPLFFDVVLTKNSKNQFVFFSDISFDRTQFGIKYKSKKFFPALGDKFILDKINLKISLMINEQI